MYVHTHTHVYTHTHTHARTHACTHTHAHTHARTHACTHTHAHTRTHTHTGRRTSVSPNNRLLSDIGRAATLLGELMRTHEIHPLKKITLKSHSYHNSCSGTAFVDWILGLSFILPLTRPQAVGVGQSLLDQGVILECCGKSRGVFISCAL